MASSAKLSVEEVERTSLESMTFVPTDAEIDELIEKSLEAEKLRSAGQRGPLLSKLHQLPPNVGLCPESLNPNDTILAKLGRGDVGPGGKIGDKEVMTIIMDRNMPMSPGNSCGPNGVLTDCQNKYGPHRMNLFHKDLATTKTLLSDYLAVRNNNAADLLKMYCSKLSHEDHREKFKLDPGKDATLDEELRPHYVNTCKLFNLLSEQLKSNDLGSVGLRCISFCQTWLRKGTPVGNAQFSVMSPHFQTRHIVSDEAKVKALLGEQAEELLQSYATMVTKFDESMSKDYGQAGGGAAFVHLDDLADKLNKK